jgi:hypothetical protein
MCNHIVSGCTQPESRYEPKSEERVSVSTASMQSLRPESFAIESTTSGCYKTFCIPFSSDSPEKEVV